MSFIDNIIENKLKARSPFGHTKMIIITTRY